MAKLNSQGEKMKEVNHQNPVKVLKLVQSKKDWDQNLIYWLWWVYCVLKDVINKCLQLMHQHHCLDQFHVEILQITVGVGNVFQHAHTNMQCLS